MHSSLSIHCYESRLVSIAATVLRASRELRSCTQLWTETKLILELPVDETRRSGSCNYLSISSFDIVNSFHRLSSPLVAQRETLIFHILAQNIITQPLDPFEPHV